MWKVYCDKYLLYHAQLDDYKIFSPSLTLELNKTGSFTFTIRPNHPNYDKLKKFQTDTQPTLVPCIIIRNDGMPLSLTYTDKDGIKETVDSKELFPPTR